MPTAPTRTRKTTRRPAGKAPRGRGRPPAAPEAHAAIRRRLLDATRTVFTRTGFHGLSVELVLAEAGLSRPTFYKHFHNTTEPLDEVLREVNDRLITSLVEAAGGAREPFAALEAGLLAWRRWGEELGPLLRPLFAELHDVHSPASAHRRRTLGILGEQVARLAENLGRPRPTRLQLDALLNGVEYIGYRYQLETARDAASWKEARDAMLRLAIALLGNAHEWQHATQLAQALGIELSPRDNP